ncbi:MAG: PQQ-binding-like beta-propeller repeat protein [Planctomycetota bacterium]
MIKLPRRWIIWAGLVLVGLGLSMLLAITMTSRVGEKPAETVAETSTESSAEIQVEDSGEKPNEMPAEKPTEKMANKPAEKPIEKPAEKPAEKPIEKPIEKPAEKPADKLNGTVNTVSAELRRKAAVADVQFDPNDSIEAWEQLGRAVLETGTEAEFQEYQKARMETLTDGGPLSPSLVNEVLRLLYAEQRWEEMQRFEKQLKQPSTRQVPVNAKPKQSKKQLKKQPNQPPARRSVDNPQLFAWMYDRTLGRSAKNSVPTADLRQPLIVPVSRGASGLFQNLRAALEDKQYREAARLLTNSYALRAEGLMATPGDEQLFVSYRSMQLILLHRRELAEVMSGQLDGAALLGILQTLSQGDPMAVEALTVQYYGTPAHASACQWLGDRALAGADFTQALSWYEEGRPTASPDRQPDLAARVRLASAMLGNLRGEPPKQPVSFGETRLSPEQFERRVRDAVARQAKTETASLVDTFPILPAPQPVQFCFATLGQPDESGSCDALSGNIAVVAHDDLLIVSNRKQAIAIESASGKRRWSWELGKSVLSSPIRPLVQGPRIFLRTTTVSGRYGIVCLDKKTGRGLWRRDCGDNVAGDPQLIQGRLVVLTLGAPTDSGRKFSSPLYLVELDAESGEVLSRRGFAEVSRTPNRLAALDRPPEYQSICVGNRLVVLFSGAVFCLDLQGKVQWMRNSIAIPAEIDPVSHSQPCQLPREAGGLLYLQQPGSCAVECLAARTGQLVWRRGVIGLQQILDLHDDRLLVQSTYGLTALHAATGQVLWRRELPGMDAALARNAAGQILCACQVMQGDKSRLALLWIDAASGKTKAHSLFPSTNPASAVTLGPILVSGEQVLCCQGSGNKIGAKQAGNNTRISTMQSTGPALEGDLP